MTVSGTPTDASPHTIEDFRRGFKDQGRLRGLRSACGFATATWGLRCPRCGDRLVEVELPLEGSVVSFTVQTVPSEGFMNDAPYAYVIVDLGGAVISGWMPGLRSPDELAIGTKVRFRPSYRNDVQFERLPGPTPPKDPP
jgi:uncharacterized OB-fold protein